MDFALRLGNDIYMLGRGIKTFITIAGMILLAIHFFWMFHVNLLFIDSFDLLPVRDIDDLIFHAQLLVMRDYLREGDWIAYFSSTEFSYGNIFWSSISIGMEFFREYFNPSVVIAMPRMISLMFCLLTFYGVYSIGRLLNAERVFCILYLLLLASCSSLMNAATRFHNHAWYTCFVVWSYYFLIKDTRLRSVIVASFLMGIAIAIKIVAFMILPLFFILLNRDFREQKSWRAIFKKNAMATGVGVVTFLIAFSPNILLMPFGYKEFYESFSRIYFMVFLRKFNPWPAEQTVFWNLKTNFFQSNFHYYICAFLLVLSLFFLVKNWRKKDIHFALALMTLVSFAVVVYIAKKTLGFPVGLMFYTQPIAVFFPILLLSLSALRPIWGWLLLPILVFNLYLNNEFYWHQVIYVNHISNSEDTKTLLADFEKRKDKVEFSEEGKIFIDHPLIFPFNFAEHFHQIYYIFDSDTDMDFNKNDIYIVNKSDDHYTKECEEIKNYRGYSEKNCRSLKEMMMGQSTEAKTLYDDEKVRVIQHL